MEYFCTVDSIIYGHCNGRLLLVSYWKHSSIPYKKSGHNGISWRTITKLLHNNE